MTDAETTRNAIPARGPSTRGRRWIRRAVIVAVLAGLAWAMRPPAVNLALDRGRVNLQSRDHSRALFWLNLAHSIESENAEGHFLLARVHRRLDNFDLVRHHLLRAHELGWNPRELKREQLMALAQTGQYSEMSHAFLDLLETAGSDGPEISEAFVLMMLSRFRLRPALQIVGAWKQDFPDDPQPYILHGRILTVLRNWKDAEGQYSQALEMDPSSQEARRKLARCLMEQLRYQQAESHLRTCLANDPDNMEMLVALAICLRKRERSAEARKLLQDHWTAAQTNFEAQREMGHIELAAERPEAAVKHLRRAAEINPADREARYILAQALRASGHAEAAQKELAFVNEATKPVLRLGTIVPKLVDRPDDVALRFEIAETTWKYKSRSEGAKWFHSLLQFDPNHVPTHRALARHYEKIGDAKRARHHRQKVQRVVGKP